MWKNKQARIYFYPVPYKCFNIRSGRFFTVSKELKEDWRLNGNSKFIGPECLGGW